MKVKFNLSRNYKLIPEGEQVLTINDVTAIPSGAPKEVKITWVDSEGTMLIDKCNFTNTLWKLSRVCEAVFGIKDGEEMDLNDIIAGLKGKSLNCVVKHTKGTTPREDGSYATFVNIDKIMGLADITEEVLPTVMAQSTNPRDSILSGL